MATRDITLLPIGGVARIEKMPDNPRHELIVVIAGPAVNVALAIILGLALLVLGRPIAGDLTSPDLLTQLLWLNVTLAVFNLLPAFPMDGGRALRAVLAMRTDNVRATEVAARLGKATAFVFDIIGLFSSPVLLFIAIFVWLGADAELGVARLEGALDATPVAAATIREFHCLAPADRLEVPVGHAIAGFQHDFPVLDRGRVVGVLTHRALLTALADRGLRSSVRAAMLPRPASVAPDQPLVDALKQLGAAESNCLLVVEPDDRLVGLLTMHSVGELVAIREAVGVAGTAAVAA
ncbi:MAG: site-2 protease family protein [Myxococcota bacterium]